MFPFARFPGVDVHPGPGDEVDRRGHGAGVRLPLEGAVFISVRDRDKSAAVECARALQDMGFTVIATRGTARYMDAEGVTAEIINKVMDGRPDIVDAMKSGTVDLVFNTTEGALAIEDSFSLRNAALTGEIPYYTTIAGARAAVEAIAAMRSGTLEVAPVQSYFGASF